MMEHQLFFQIFVVVVVVVVVDKWVVRCCFFFLHFHGPYLPFLLVYFST